MATTTRKTRSRRKTVNFTDLEALITRRKKSGYPADSRAERQYWLKQLNSLLGNDEF